MLRHAIRLAPLILVAACTASAEQVAPPRYDFYFPTGVQLSPDERFLFVISANSDLRYSAGAVQVVDLDQVDALADAWRDGGQVGTGCAPIPARPTILSCPSSRADGSPATGIVGGASVQIGNFGVNGAVQPLGDGTRVRFFVTVRGDPSVTWADFDAATGKLRCGGTGDFPRCDEPHRLVRLRNDATLPSLPPEPFDIVVDAADERGYVTHLTTGQVTLIEAPGAADGTPLLQDSISNLWSVSVGGLGAVGVAPRLPGDPRGLVYVTSRQEARVAIIHAVFGPAADGGQPTQALVRTSSFLFDGLNASGDLGDARNLAFSPDGNHAYLVSRTPASLQLFDTSLDGQGAPQNVQLGALEICPQPANLALADFGQGVRAALPCFSTGQVWIVDPERLRLLAIEDAGRGPSAIAASARHRKIYVGNYAEDTLTIIDATPGSAWQHRAVLRLGKPRVVGN